MSKTYNFIIFLRVIIGIILSVIIGVIILIISNYIFPELDIHDFSNINTSFSLWDGDQKVTALTLFFIYILLIFTWLFTLHILCRTPISVTDINKTKFINRIMLRSGLITVVGLSASANISQMHQSTSTVSSADVHQTVEEKQPLQNIDNKIEKNENIANEQQEIYTIKEGDSLWTIGAHLYNDPIRYKEILAHNNGKYTDGTQIKRNVLIPGKQLSYVKDSNNNKPLSDTTIITLKSGDTLSDISHKYLGDASRWHEIANFNKITNPHSLQVGDTINIPNNIINHKSQENKSDNKTEENKEEKQTTPATESTVAKSKSDIKPTNEPSTIPSQIPTKTKASSPLSRNDSTNHSNNNSTTSPVMVTTFVSAPVILALTLLAYKRNKRKQIERVKRENPDANIKIVEDKVLPINKVIYNDILSRIQQLVNYLSAIDKKSSIFYILAKKDRFRVCFEFQIDDERLAPTDEYASYDVLYEDLADVNMYVEKSAVIEIGQIGEDRLLIDLFHLNLVLCVPNKAIQERIITSLKYAEWTSLVELSIVGKYDIGDTNLDNNQMYKCISVHKTLQNAIDNANSEDVQNAEYYSFILVNGDLREEDMRIAHGEVREFNNKGICVFGSDYSWIVHASIRLVKDDHYQLIIGNMSLDFKSDFEEVKTVKAIEGRKLYVGTTSYADPEIITTKREEKIKPRFIVHFFNGMRIIDTKTGKPVLNFGKISIERMGYYLLHDTVTEDFLRNIYGRDAPLRIREDINTLNKHIRKSAEDTGELRLIIADKNLYGKTFTVDRSICDADFKLIDENNLLVSLQEYIKHPIPTLTELATDKTFRKIEQYIIDIIIKHIDQKFKTNAIIDIPPLINIGLIIDDESHKVWSRIKQLSEVDSGLSAEYEDRIYHMRAFDNAQNQDNIDFELLNYLKLIRDNNSKNE